MDDPEGLRVQASPHLHDPRRPGPVKQGVHLGVTVTRIVQGAAAAHEVVDISVRIRSAAPAQEGCLVVLFICPVQQGAELHLLNLNANPRLGGHGLVNLGQLGQDRAGGG